MRRLNLTRLAWQAPLNIPANGESKHDNKLAGTRFWDLADTITILVPQMAAWVLAKFLALQAR